MPKHYGRCLADLQVLVSEIVRLRVEAIKGLFPDAPSGFSAEDAEGATAGGLALLGAGTQVKRTYRRDESSLEATIWADAGLALQGFQMLLQNPALLGDGRQMVTVKGRKALLEYDKEAKRGTHRRLGGVGGWSSSPARSSRRTSSSTSSAPPSTTSASSELELARRGGPPHVGLIFMQCRA
jgi:hypothetical protein